MVHEHQFVNNGDTNIWMANRSLDNAEPNFNSQDFEFLKGGTYRPIIIPRKITRKPRSARMI